MADVPRQPTDEPPSEDSAAASADEPTPAEPEAPVDPTGPTRLQSASAPPSDGSSDSALAKDDTAARIEARARQRLFASQPADMPTRVSVGPAGSGLDAIDRAALDPLIGSLIGSYVINDVLGEGGMGQVYRAFDRRLSRQVALKVLHPNLVGLAQPRLIREAQAMAQLAHPNVVQVYEVGEHEGLVFVVMELVEGETLKQWQQQEPRPGWRACVEIYLQAGAGLKAAHEVGLVHRDFKPANALVDERGRVRVLDFGLARVDLEPDSEETEQDGDGRPRSRSGISNSWSGQRLTQTGAVMGTPAYMPPEQMSGEPVDARGDQFSFCMALYEAVYGERMYEGRSLAELMAAMHDGVVRPLPAGSKVPAVLHEVLVRGLAYEPSERWPSMDELLEQLQRLVTPRKWGRLAGAGLALAAVAGATTLYLGTVVGEQEEQLTEKEMQLAQKVVELEQTNRDLNDEKQRSDARLFAQMGLRAKDVSEDHGRELEAVRIAVEAYGGIAGKAGPVPAPVFEGLTHSLAGISDGLIVRGHDSPIRGVAVSPDGAILATASDYGKVRLWDARSGAARQTLEGHEETVWSVAFSPDGTKLVTGGEDHTVRLWDATTGTELDSLEQQHPVRSVMFSADGTRIAMASGDAGWVWHLGSEDLQVPLVGHAGRVRSVALSPGGSEVVTASEDHTVRVWDAQTGAVLRTLEGHTDEVFDVTMSADGSTIASGGRDGTARLWDAATGAPRATFELDDVVYAVAFSPDGSRLATGTFEDGTARIWDVATGRRVDQFHQSDETIFDVAFSPDGSRLYTVSRDFTARIWDLEQRVLDPGHALVALKHDRRVDAVAVSPDGTRTATGSGEGSIRLWDSETGALLMTLEGGHAIDVLDVTFSPDGGHLATASWDGSVRVWDSETGAVVQTFVEHIEPVRAVRFSPDGTRVITASRDGTARVWSMTTDASLRTLEHGSPLVDAVVSPDGERLLTVGADESVTAWDVTTGEPREAPSAGNTATALAFSPDGTRIATATKDSVVHVRDTESGRLVASMPGHSTPVTTMTFSTDGTRIATASDDGTARVWDAAAGTPLAVIPHDGPVQSIALSPDGEHLTTASGDHQARRWLLRPEAWHAWGCAWLGMHDTAMPRGCPELVAEAPPALTTPPIESLVMTPEPARPLPETKIVHGVELVLIPGGTFTMGSPPTERGHYDGEGPQHEVTLSSFYLARTELTNAQFALFLEANPDIEDYSEAERYDQPNQPVNNMTWYEAKAYCEWAGLTIPTEAQWEYAVRAGTTTAYWFGDDGEDLERFGWYTGNTKWHERDLRGSRPHAVGLKGSNPFGLYDMTGNVYEWTLDAWGFYDPEPRPRPGDGLRHDREDDRIIRGGGWYNTAKYTRSANRDSHPLAVRFEDIGFRPAMAVPPGG